MSAFNHKGTVIWFSWRLSIARAGSTMAMSLKSSLIPLRFPDLRIVVRNCSRDRSEVLCGGCAMIGITEESLPMVSVPMETSASIIISAPSRDCCSAERLLTACPHLTREKSERISGKKSATDGNNPNVSIAARGPAPCSALRQAIVDETANNKYNGIVMTKSAITRILYLEGPPLQK